LFVITGITIVFIYKETAFCASNLPITEAPLSRFIAFCAKIVPTNIAPELIVTLAPATYQKILLALAPPLRYTLVELD